MLARNQKSSKQYWERSHIGLFQLMSANFKLGSLVFRHFICCAFNGSDLLLSYLTVGR